MKSANKLFVPLILATLGTVTCLNSANNQYFAKQVNAEENNKNELQDDSCTVMYVGKSVSENGLPIIARTGDGRNSLIYHNLRVYEQNELASKVMNGKNGFTWEMPSSTYRFSGFPRSNSVDDTRFWCVSTMNEEGLAVSATLSCFSDEDRVLKYDPFIETGISEDNIAAVLAATSATAKESMQYLANIVDTKGSAEANIVLSIDQKEAWLMEIYSGHQYCAIKLPDDKATTIGNEFFLDSLIDYDDNNIIVSANLFSLPKEKGFAVFDGGYDDKNMDLFLTYARPLTYSNEISIDASHMRTWRGSDLFAIDEDRVDYQTITKFKPFFTPKRKLSINDFFTYFRDDFLDILENPDPKYDIFRQRDAIGRLRAVATETSYQVHVIMVHPDLPKDMAVEAWICLGNAIGAPFVPFNNSMNEFPKEYTHEIKYYGADEESALFIYRRVSAIAYLHEKEYALPVQKFWNVFENIWHKQYDLCLNKALELIAGSNKDDAKRLLNNYLFDAQTRALNEAKYLYKDLLAQFIEEQKRYNETIQDFDPKTDILAFADLYGYDYKIDNSVITLTNGEKVVTINFENLDSTKYATIAYGESSESYSMRLTDDGYYGDLLILNNVISEDTSLKELNYNELMNRGKTSILAPILITSIAAFLLILSCLIIMLIKKRNNKNSCAK